MSRILRLKSENTMFFCHVIDTQMWFQFHFDSVNTFLLISLVVWPNECQADKETCDMTCEKQNTAVVLYDESLLSPFMKQSRSFTFVSREIVVKQDWGQLGVAAVVWDAVSRMHYIWYC